MFREWTFLLKGDICIRHYLIVQIEFWSTYNSHKNGEYKSYLNVSLVLIFNKINLFDKIVPISTGVTTNNYQIQYLPLRLPSYGRSYHSSRRRIRIVAGIIT